MRLSRLSSILVSTAMLALAAPAIAQTPAFTVAGTPGTLGNPPFTLGYEFTLSQSYTLSGLGLFDADGDGLFNSYDIGLFDGAGTLLSSTTLGSGTAGTLIGGYRFATVASQLLGAGTYRIGAVFTNADGEDALYFAGDPNTITGVAGATYVGSRFAFGGVLSDPTFTAADGGYFGPNLLLGGAVPEPASWALMIGGIGLAGGALRRRRTSLRVTYA